MAYFSGLAPEILRKLENCTCGSDEKAIYFCYNDSCLLIESKYLFCDNCCEVHDHRILRIDRCVLIEEKEWKNLISVSD